jgi:hypothetical protein
MNQHTSSYDIDEVFVLVEREAGVEFVHKLQDMIADCVTKYVGNVPRLAIRYSNDPSLALGRDPNQPLPEGVFFLNVMVLDEDVVVVPGKAFEVEPKVFIVIDFKAGTITDNTDRIVTLQ